MPEPEPLNLTDTEILEHVKKAEEHYGKRTDQMEKNLDLYEVKARTAAPGGVSVTDNSPHTAVRLAAAILSRKKPVWTKEARTEKKTEKIKAARYEQVIQGVREDHNLRAFRRGDLPPDYENILNFMGMGWYATRVIVKKNKKGLSPFRHTRNYHPINVFQGPQTEDGYQWIAAKTHVEGGLVLANSNWSKAHGEINESDPYQPLEKVDWYDGVHNVILINDIEVQRWEHEQGEVPWITGPVGGHNFRGSPQLEGRDFVDKMGMAITYATQDLYDYYNELLETLGLIVKKYAKPTIIVKTRDGNLRNIELGSGAINPALLTDVIEVLPLPGAPPDIVVLLQAVSQAIQRATFNETVYGGMPEAGLSGLALTLTGHHAGLILEPYLEILRLYDKEYGRRVFQGIEREELSSQLYKGIGNNGVNFTLNDFSYQEVMGDYDIASTRVIDMPEDMMMKAQIAGQLSQGETPLVSAQYARDKILLVEDPLKERNRIIGELPFRLPNISLAMALQILTEQGEDGAAAILAQTMGVQMGGPAQVGGGGGEGGGEGGGSEMGMTGQPLPPALQLGQQVSPMQAAQQGGQQGQGNFPMTGFS